MGFNSGFKGLIIPVNPEMYPNKGAYLRIE